MKGRIRTILVSVCLLSVLASALGAGMATADERQPAPESRQETPAVYSAAESVAEDLPAEGEPAGLSGTEDISDGGAPGGGLINPEQVKEYYEKIREMVDSETFQSLIRYPEVQELVLEFVRLGAGVMANDSELAEKIMLELGIAEETAGFILFMMQEAASEIESDKYVDSEKEQAFANAVDEFVASGELTGLLGDLGILRDEGASE